MSYHLSQGQSPILLNVKYTINLTLTVLITVVLFLGGSEGIVTTAGTQGPH